MRVGIIMAVGLEEDDEEGVESLTVETNELGSPGITILLFLTAGAKEDTESELFPHRDFRFFRRSCRLSTFQVRFGFSLIRSLLPFDILFGLDNNSSVDGDGLKLLRTILKMSHGSDYSKSLSSSVKVTSLHNNKWTELPLSETSFMAMRRQINLKLSPYALRPKVYFDVSL